MATAQVIDPRAPYYTIRVQFDEQEFEQLIVSSATGAELDALLQAYAAEYEAAWLALVEAEAQEGAERWLTT
jgi:hypothetical protein